MLMEKWFKKSIYATTYSMPAVVCAVGFLFGLTSKHKQLEGWLLAPVTACTTESTVKNIIFGDWFIVFCFRISDHRHQSGSGLPAFRRQRHAAMSKAVVDYHGWRPGLCALSYARRLYIRTPPPPPAVLNPAHRPPLASTHSPPDLRLQDVTPCSTSVLDFSLCCCRAKSSPTSFCSRRCQAVLRAKLRYGGGEQRRSAVLSVCLPSQSGRCGEKIPVVVSCKRTNQPLNKPRTSAWRLE